MKKKLWCAFASAAASLLLAAAVLPMSVGAAWKQTDVIGDLNGDGTVTVSDIVIMSKFLQGSEKLGENSVFTMKDGVSYSVRIDGSREVRPALGTKKIQKADMDQNGSIEIFDLVKLRKVLISAIPQGEILYWDDIPAPITTTTTATTTTTTFTTTTISTTSEAQKNDFIVPPVADMYGSMPSQGNVNLLVFYVDFPDCKFAYNPSAEEIDRIAFGEEDYRSSEYPFESFSAFAARASKGALDLKGKTYKYTCKKSIAAYEGDIYKSDFITEVVKNMDIAVDYSKFDSDHDEVVDTVLFCVPSSADSDEWWSCAGGYYGEPYLRLDGMSLGHVITGNAAIAERNDYSNFIATYLHEMGHCMGLPDYYLYRGEDFEGMHGSAGYDLMDEALSDYSAASKLMLGWLREDQVQVYDPSMGEQSFILRNGQSDEGNCLIIPRYDFDGSYKTEFFILEYMTLDANNSHVAQDFYWRPFGSGISVKHIEATEADDGWRKFFLYESGNDEYTDYDRGRRFIRLVDDEKPDNFFRDGDVISSVHRGFAWYDSAGKERVDTGIAIRVSENPDNTYTVTVSRK